MKYNQVVTQLFTVNIFQRQNARKTHLSQMGQDRYSLSVDFKR